MRDSARGASSTTVRPLLLPLPLALLRGLFTAASWMILAAPLAFLGLALLLVLESPLAVVHVPTFSTSDEGDRFLGLMMGAGAMVSGTALLATIAVWALLPAIELRLARAVAADERLSAQDARRLVVPAERRVGLLLASAAVPLLTVGAIVGLLAEEPGDGPDAAVLIGLGLGSAALSLVVRRRGARSPSALAALEAVWPPVASTPESVTAILAREHLSAEEPASDAPPRGRRRSDARPPTTGSSRSATTVMLVSAGFAGIVLSDVLEYDGPLLGIPFALLLAAVALVTLAALRRARRSGRSWALDTSVENAPRASAAAYTRRHPAALRAALLALAAAVTLTAAITVHWHYPAASSSKSIPAGPALGALRAALLLVSIGCSATEHRETRAWRERFLLAHPVLDPFWSPDLHHDGLQSIHGWLNGDDAPPHARRNP